VILAFGGFVNEIVLYGLRKRKSGGRSSAVRVRQRHTVLFCIQSHIAVLQQCRCLVDSGRSVESTLASEGITHAKLESGGIGFGTPVLGDFTEHPRESFSVDLW